MTREPIQLRLPFDDDVAPCKECFMQGCDCPCATCEAMRPRNDSLTKLELTRLQVEAGLLEAGIDPVLYRKFMRML